MTTYFPVAAVTPNTHAVPDDSTLTTRPRGQVDYLSHDWQEEDVWRSWRNMTRQKNEIANGIRLENASWRTWWKQRNKLKTVTPETLNWLKDSDVTWLYGPLHTASEYAPPPRPLADVGSTAPRPQKPILKHRSISELLTSDFPTASSTTGQTYDDDDIRILYKVNQARPNAKRPILPHTKSDTNLARWGPGSIHRRDSPPRMEPPGLSGKSSKNAQFAPSSIRASASQDSNSSSGGEKPKKRHISFNTFVLQYIAIEKPKKVTTESFREEDEDQDQDIDEGGYEEDQEDEEEDIEDEEEEEVGEWNQQRPRGTCVIRSDSEDDDEDDENDDEDDILEMRPSIRNTPKKKPSPRSHSQVSTTSSSSSASTSTTSSNGRDSIPNTPSTSSPGSSLSPTRKNQNRKPSPVSSTGAPRPPVRRHSSYTSSRHPPLIRKPSEQHITIAPIAPTLLKTGGWTEGFGDECPSDDGMTGWLNSFVGGNEYSGRGRGQGAFGTGKGSRVVEEEEAQGSDGTPVELVYVPPLGSSYKLGFGDHDQDTIDDEMQDLVDQTPQPVRNPPRRVSNDSPIGSGSPSNGSAPIPIASSRSASDAGVPTVVLDPSPDRDTPGKYEDPYDYFGGPDFGEDYFYGRRGGRGYERPSQPLVVKANQRERERQRERQQVVGGERQSRSRSRSQSRTPSPAFSAANSTAAGAADTMNERGRQKSAGASISTSPCSSHLTSRGSASSLVSPTDSKADLLSPPISTHARGRTATDASSSLSSSVSSSGSRAQPTIQTRGRSSTRTSSTCSSSSVGSSPIGSLSPDGSGGASIDRVIHVGSSLANGRTVKDSSARGEQDRGRESRGRRRTSNKVVGAVSNEPESSLVMGDPLPGPPPTRPTAPKMEASFSSATTSSSSSTVTATLRGPVAVPTPSWEEEARQRQASSEVEFMRLAEEHHWRMIHPTPSNSPVVEMVRPPPKVLDASEACVEQFEESDSSAQFSWSGSELELGTGGSVTPTLTSVSPGSNGTPSILSTTQPPRSSLSTPTTPTALSHSRTFSNSMNFPPSPGGGASKVRSPPLSPTPSLPAKPSTSFAAVSSPVKLASPGRRAMSPPSSSSRARSSSAKRLEMDETTIMGKAVDMVSSVGGYLGFWTQNAG